MRSNWNVFSILVAVCVVAISTQALRATGQTVTATTPSAASTDPRRLAVGIIRLINTAEVVDCRNKGGKIDENEKFLPWEELLSAPCFKQAQSHFRGMDELSLSSGPEIVPGLEFRLVVSPDGKHYNLWLGQKREVNCGFAFYSDERGVIYEGKAIGCSAEGVASNWDATNDQKTAVGCIRTINTAEVVYAKEYKKGWSPTLAALGVPPKGVKFSAEAAGLVDNSLTGGTKANYVFTYTPGKPDADGKITTYTLSVRPVKWHEGLWNFYDDDSGKIRGTQENRAVTVNDPPL